MDLTLDVLRLRSWNCYLFMMSPKKSYRQLLTAGRRTGLFQVGALLLGVGCRVVSPKTIYIQTIKTNLTGCTYRFMHNIYIPIYVTMIIKEKARHGGEAFNSSTQEEVAGGSL